MEEREVESTQIVARMIVPEADSLYCFTASINPREEKDPSAKSDFHWQTIKCRLLLFSMPVLACPVRAVSGPLRDLTVVCRREDIMRTVPEEPDDDRHSAERDSPLYARLTELRLTVSRLRRVTDPEYSACLEYTLTANLAPLWNPLEEDRLVHGKDFLTCGRPADSVRLQVNVYGQSGIAWLGLRLCRLRIAPLVYGDLDVSGPILERFQDDPLGHVPATCIGRPWVHVLPSLKKGMVVAIDKTMPEHCPFAGYKNLRRHWKNMYGYRLPEDPTGVEYCSVYFSLLGAVPMTYPKACLTPRRPTTLRCLDPQAVAVAFLGVVATRMRTVCGSPSPVSLDGLAVPVVALCSADLGAQGPSSMPNLRPLLADNTDNFSSASRTPTPEDEDDDEDDDESSIVATCPLSLATQRDGTRPNVAWNLLKRPPREEDNKENRAPEDSGRDPSRASLGTPRLTLHRPVFRARAPVHATPRIGASTDRPVWFRPSSASTPTRETPSPSTIHTASSASSATSSRKESAVEDESPTTMPAFRVPAHKPIFLARPTAFPSTPGRTGPRPQGCVVTTASPRVGAVAAGVATGPSSSATLGSPRGLSAPRPATPRFIAAGPAGPAMARLPLSGALPSSPSLPRKSGTPKAAKRSSSEAPLAPNLTSVEAARRASVPMLQAWLRERGVPCRSKDKKADLVDKVAARLAQRAHVPS